MMRPILRAAERVAVWHEADAYSAPPVEPIPEVGATSPEHIAPGGRDLWESIKWVDEGPCPEGSTWDYVTKKCDPYLCPPWLYYDPDHMICTRFPPHACPPGYVYNPIHDICQVIPWYPGQEALAYEQIAEQTAELAQASGLAPPVLRAPRGSGAAPQVQPPPVVLPAPGALPDAAAAVLPALEGLHGW